MASRYWRSGGVPIVPVAIVGAYECWPRTRMAPRPGRIRLEFGAVITPTKLLVSQKSSWLSGVSTHFMHSIPLRAAHNVGACVDDLKIFFFQSVLVRLRELYGRKRWSFQHCTDSRFSPKNIGWPMGLLFRCFLTTAKKNYEIRFISIRCTRYRRFSRH